MDILKLATLPSVIFNSPSDDDFSDRLNYMYTVALLIVFAIVLTTRSYGSQTINCWIPAHFTTSYEEYVSKICWISNTYHYDIRKPLPKLSSEKKDNEIKYYQWVPFVLLFQALFFYLPRIFWKKMAIKAGLNICDLVEAAHNYKSSSNFDYRESYMNYLIQNIDQYVNDNRKSEKQSIKTWFKWFKNFFASGYHFGSYILILYFCTKLIYILNVCFQIMIISALLGKNFWYFGIFSIKRIIYEHEIFVSESKYFPSNIFFNKISNHFSFSFVELFYSLFKEISLCDFNIIEIGNPNKSHQYTVQCVLPINLFNQQIFIMVWLWYMFVLALNIINLISWVFKSLPHKAREWNLRRILLIDKRIQSRKNRINHFLTEYLDHDGLFMLRMIANNTSDYVATDVIHFLFCQHAEKYDRLFPDEPHNFPDGEPCKFRHIKKIDIHPNESNKLIRYQRNFENQKSIDFFNLDQPLTQVDDLQISLASTITTEIEKPSKLRDKFVNDNKDTTKSDSDDENIFNSRIYKKNDLVMMNKNHSKLHVVPEWVGPYKVVNREEENFYKIQCDNGGPEIKVHVKRLRKFKPISDKKKIATKILDCDLS